MSPLVASSVAFSVGGVLMRPAQGLTRPLPSAGVLACFLVGAALLAIAVHRGDLGTTYVIGLGLEAVVTVLAAFVIFGERPGPRQLSGVGLVLVGLVVLH